MSTHKIRRIHLEETVSTNTYARNTPSEDNILLITTEYQTAGRGQRGNAWESETGKNLLFSLVLHPHKLIASQQFAICEYISIILCRILRTYTPEIYIKWPNDIYWRDKKICGILIEHDIVGTHIARTIIGVGINVNQVIFISDAPNPTSLRQIIGQDLDREQLLDAICQEVISLKGITRELLHKEYIAKLYRRNSPASYRDSTGDFRATLRNVESDGRIILEDDQGQLRSYLFKEVAYII